MIHPPSYSLGVFNGLLLGIGLTIVVLILI